MTPLHAAALGRRTLLAGLAATPLAPAPARAAGGRLQPICDVPARRAAWGHPAAAAACPVPPPPQADIAPPSYYTDRSYSIVDPERLKRYHAATKNPSDFVTGIARLADQWLLSRPADPAIAACALHWLDSWASGGAMLGQLDQNGEHQRKWVLAGTALAWLKLRSAQPDPAAAQRIVDWLHRMGLASMTFYEHYAPNSMNNHHWWAALAAIAVAVAADDRALFDRGLVFYRFALDQVAPDGTLPAEMLRKGRALIYHAQSLNPLVLIAEFGEANGLKLYAHANGALHRLARRVRDGLADPGWFAAATGTPQDWGDGSSRAWTVAWAEPYYARTPDPVLARLIQASRPIFYPYFGGSPTHDFGAVQLSGA